MPIPVDKNDLYEKLDADKKDIMNKLNITNNNVEFLIKLFDKVMKLSKKK